MEAHQSIGRKIQRKPLADCTNTVSRSSQQPSSSSASLVKFANPSLTSSLKRLVDQTTLKEKTEDVSKSKDGAGITSRTPSTSARSVTRRVSADLGFPAIEPPLPSKPLSDRVDQTTLKEKSKDVSKPEAGAGSSSRTPSTSSRPVTRRMSADLGFPAIEPPPSPKPSYDRGVGDKEFAEPYSVYTVRRKPSGEKRSKDASSSSAVASLRMDLMSNSGKKTDQANVNKSKPLKAAPKKRQRTKKHDEDNLVHGVPKDYIEKQRAYFAEIDAFELEVEEVTSGSDLD